MLVKVLVLELMEVWQGLQSLSDMVVVKDLKEDKHTYWNILYTSSKDVKPVLGTKVTTTSFTFLE